MAGTYEAFLYRSATFYFCHVGEISEGGVLKCQSRPISRIVPGVAADAEYGYIACSTDLTRRVYRWDKFEYEQMFFSCKIRCNTDYGVIYVKSKLETF